MGRNMFGGGTGPWEDPPWNGWWGENPPFHLPVFVLTHHERDVLEMEGGTTFTFVSEGIDLALELARQAAQGADVAISGGAGTAKQYLAAGLLDEVMIHLVPTFLGEGVALFDDRQLREIAVEQVNVAPAPGVLHVTYRIAR
jgi:dihydrofolate reductase